MLFQKKGVAGPVNKQRLETLNSSWFYTWGPVPPFNNESDNWSADTWNTFVPLFYGKMARNNDNKY